ncbi:hypothetical protein DBV08_31430 [Rhodococcus sp. KBW08]|nr:hypothetical protein DBV08_31430 [Rhodococcus sp. KBW08]
MLVDELRSAGIEVGDPEHAGFSRHAMTDLYEMIRDHAESLTADRLGRLMNSLSCLGDCIDNYHPQLFAGNLSYISAAEHPNSKDAALLWQVFVTGEIQNVYVRVPHGSLLGPTGIAVVGPVVASFTNNAL